MLLFKSLNVVVTEWYFGRAVGIGLISGGLHTSTQSSPTCFENVCQWLVSQAYGQPSLLIGCYAISIPTCMMQLLKSQLSQVRRTVADREQYVLQG